MNNILSKLITRYPLLWNTRFPIAFGVILAINILYIVIGVLSTDTILRSIEEDGYSRDNFFESGLILLTIVTNIIFIIVWLLYYLRNNALKANYPINTGRLLSEFLQIAIIIILNFTLYPSYRIGIVIGFNGKYDLANLEEDKKIINNAAPYVSDNYYDYELTSYCAHDYNERTANKNHKTLEIKTNFCCQDSIMSYYYFCNFPYIDSYDHKWELIRYNQSLLEKREIAQIEKHITAYNELCDKYNIKSQKVDTKRIIDNIFATNNFRVDENYISTLISPNEYGYYYGNNVSNILNNIIDYTQLGQDFFMSLLILSLVGLTFTGIILSFRLTSIKEWLIAVVSLGIISILTGLTFGLGGIRDIGISITLLVIYATFFLVATLGKELGVNKVANGTAINLSLFTAPFVGLALFSLFRVEVLEGEDYFYSRPYFNEYEMILLTILVSLVLTSILLAVTPKYRASSEG